MHHEIKTPQCSGFYEKLNTLRAEVFCRRTMSVFSFNWHSIVSLKLRAMTPLSALASSLLLAWNTQSSNSSSSSCPCSQPRRWSKLHLKGQWVQCLLPSSLVRCTSTRTSPKDTKTCGWGPWDQKHCCGVQTSPTLHHTAPPRLRQWKVLQKLFTVTMTTPGKTAACKR